MKLAYFAEIYQNKQGGAYSAYFFTYSAYLIHWKGGHSERGGVFTVHEVFWYSAYSAYFAYCAIVHILLILHVLHNLHILNFWILCIFCVFTHVGLSTRLEVSSWPFAANNLQKTNRQDMVFIHPPGISDGAFQLRIDNVWFCKQDRQRIRHQDW